MWYITGQIYVHRPLHHESMSITVQHNATTYSFIIFLQTALHVSDDTLIHQQEHIEIVITSGTGQTVFATVRWRGGVRTGRVPTPPQQRTVANTVQRVPDVITVWVCSWWWMRVSYETCRVVCRNIIKAVYSRILLDSYWQWHWASCAQCFVRQLLLTFIFIFRAVQFNLDCLALTMRLRLSELSGNTRPTTHSHTPSWVIPTWENQISQNCFSMNFKQCQKLK